MSPSLEGPSGPEKRGPAEIAPSTEPDAKLDKKRSQHSKNANVRQAQRRGFTGHLQRLDHLVVQLPDTVLEAIQIHCDAGSTGREIAALTGLRSHVVAPRLSRLQAAGSIAKIGKKWDGARSAAARYLQRQGV